MDPDLKEMIKDINNYYSYVPEGISLDSPSLLIEHAENQLGIKSAFGSPLPPRIRAIHEKINSAGARFNLGNSSGGYKKRRKSSKRKSSKRKSSKRKPTKKTRRKTRRHRRR